MNLKFSCENQLDGVYAFSTENAEYLSKINFKGKTCLSVVGGGCVPIFMGALGAKKVITFDCNEKAYKALKLKYKNLKTISDYEVFLSKYYSFPQILCEEFSSPQWNERGLKYYASSKYDLRVYNNQELYDVLSNYAKTAKVPRFYKCDLGNIEPVLTKINKKFDIVYLSNIISQDANVRNGCGYSSINRDVYNTYIFNILEIFRPFLNNEFTIIADYFYTDSMDNNCGRLLDSKLLLDKFNVTSFLYPIQSKDSIFGVNGINKDVAVVLKSANIQTK